LPDILFVQDDVSKVKAHAPQEEQEEEEEGSLQRRKSDARYGIPLRHQSSLRRLLTNCLSQRLQRVSGERSTVTLQGPGVKKWKAASNQPCNRMPLIAFGDAMFGGPRNSMKHQGKQSGLVDVLWRVLRRRENLGQLVAITVDEYLTSQVPTNTLAPKRNVFI
jgi:hypothetical protein